MVKKTFVPTYHSFIVPAIIGAAATVGGAVAGGLFGNRKQKKQNEFNAKEAEKQRDWATSEREAVQEFELDMWNKSNEYNSLSSQLERAKEAGVSPNAILNGGVTTPTANPVSSSVGSGASAFNSGDFSSTLSNTISNIGIQSANVIKTLDEADYFKSLTNRNKQEYDFFEQTKETQAKIMQSNLDKNFSEIQKNFADAGLKDVEKKQIEEMLPWISKMEGAKYEIALQEVNNLRTANSEMIQKIANLEKEGALIDAKTTETKANADLLSAKKETETANKELVGAQKDYYTELKDTEDKNQSIKDFEIEQNELKKKFCTIMDMPYDVSQSNLYYRLWLAGELESFLQDVTNSNLKPTDKYVPESYSSAVGVYGVSSSATKQKDVSGNTDKKGNRKSTVNPKVKPKVPLKHVNPISK